ncbi:2-dehydropantoate 2-reductase [Balamuthia mandrillaris]
MKVAIVGAGSIGCFVGGALCYHAGCDVVLIGRAYLRDEVDRNGGIRLSTLDEEEAVLVDRDRFPLRVATEMTEECLRDRDFVLVTVKAKDTHDVALALAKAKNGRYPTPRP